MISVNNLTKEFERPVKVGRKTGYQSFNAVDNISFEVQSGKIFGVLGPNGAGKTTLLRMLAGIMTPSSGSISVNGIKYSEDITETKKLIGYLSGNTKLYGRLSARELLHTFGSLYELTPEILEERTTEIFDLLEIGSFADTRIENLSTGQCQRVSIARCLIHSPDIYIFDEPTLGLDVLTNRTIISFMQKEKEKGKTVLYSTHYMEEADTLCDELIMIHKGHIIAKGTKEELKALTETTNLRETFIKLLRERGEIL